MKRTKMLVTLFRSYIKSIFLISVSLAILAVTLVSCAEIPDTVVQSDMVITIPDSITTDAADETIQRDINGAHETDPSIDTSEEAIEPTISAELDEANLKTLAKADGQSFFSTIEGSEGKTITLKAQVDVSCVEHVSCYEYNMVPMTEDKRESLFASYFGDCASEMEYDALNDLWRLRKSDQVGDYYQYQVTYSFSEAGIPGEKVFILEYRNVNLYPFQDNLLETVSSVALDITLEEALAMCEELIDSISDADEYQVDYILPFGNNGRRPYYWIVYKRVLDGMPITSYRDLKFLVDSNGVQEMSGALFTVGEADLDAKILSVDEAVNTLRNYATLISFQDYEGFLDSEMTISKITLEYIVLLDLYGKPVITPVWRFQVGENEEERNLLRDRILAVNAITGELVQGRRRHTF